MAKTIWTSPRFELEGQVMKAFAKNVDNIHEGEQN